MKVGEVCHRDAVTIDRSRSLRDAAMLMRDRDVGELVVTESTPEGAQAIGVLSERDLVVGVIARGLDAGQTTVDELARPRLVTVSQNASVEEAMCVMQNAGVRRALLTTPDRRLVGQVAMDDVLDAVASELSGLIGALRSGLEHEPLKHGPVPLGGRAEVAVPAP
ncbi:MAG TPA: CBS domain-containing protein [Burkholderiaceae bacterium]|nr:CBS domain-containing protein [Burkholderiaceae bacterium]